jgi:serine/threonine protein phosphatase PrpC
MAYEKTLQVAHLLLCTYFTVPFEGTVFPNKEALKMTQTKHDIENTLPATIGSDGVTVVGRTHQGMVRTQNEDTFGAFMSLGLFVVCDGMGGHAGGDIASNLALRTVFHSVFESNLALGDAQKPSLRFQQNSLQGAIHRAHHAIREQVQREPKLEGMGTTFAAIQVNPGGMILSHVGDSRIYRWSARRGLVQLTRDHSLVNQLKERGRLKEGDAERMKNVIVNAVGVTACRPETTVVQRHEGDVYLLCSDGLTDLVPHERIQDIVERNHESLERAAQELVAAANQAGGHDNVTVLLLRDDIGSEAPAPSRSVPFISGRGPIPKGSTPQHDWLRATIQTLSGWRKGPDVDRATA